MLVDLRCADMEVPFDVEVDVPLAIEEPCRPRRIHGTRRRGPVLHVASGPADHPPQLHPAEADLIGEHSGGRAVTPTREHAFHVVSHAGLRSTWSWYISPSRISAASSAASLRGAGPGRLTRAFRFQRPYCFASCAKIDPTRTASTACSKSVRARSLSRSWSSSR